VALCLFFSHLSKSGFARQAARDATFYAVWGLVQQDANPDKFPGRAPREDVMNLMSAVRSWMGKIVLTGVAMSGVLVFAGAPAAQAQERPVVRYDNFREREAIARHGYFSPQAAYWRHERFEHRWRDRYGYWHRY